jgi:hypothetical protein
MTKESDIQKAVYKWFWLQYPKYKRSFQSSLNGINIPSDPKTVSIIINSMKAQGMCLGQSDIFIAVARHGFNGKYIELKTMTGKPTQAQLDFGDDMVEQGYAFEVVKGFDACIGAIKSYMN